MEDLLPADDTSRSPTDDDRRLQQAQRRLEQLSVAALAFSTQLDFHKLLVDIGEHASRILPVDRVVVYSNLDSQLVAEASHPASASLPTPCEDVHWCVRYGKPKVANLLETHGEPVRNRISVPLVATQNRVLAVLEFQNKLTGGDSPTRINERLCAWRGWPPVRSIERFCFFRIEEWRRSIETLLSFNATVNQRLAPEQMVRELVVNVTGFLGAQGGMAGIVIRTEAGVHLECDGFYFGGLWTSFSRRWAPGEGIPGSVYETQFPYLSSDYQSDPLRERDLSDAFALGSCICVPIKNRKEDVLGFFQIHRRDGGTGIHVARGRFP